ncbi:MAG: zinc dependent phospholipase C family protein [Clostridium sp.]|nr:zinc dependent phospholipase C family protein [Clostridium sp.]
MAFWSVHFLISDWFIKRLDNLDVEYFVIGNIAPDCSPACNGGYYPPSEVTHVTHNGNNKSNCDYQFIYDNYIANARENKARSFWIGYYVHLFTDVLWSRQLYYAKKAEQKTAEQEKYFKKKIREEWSNFDQILIREKPSESFEIFKQLPGFDEAYPDFYKDNEIARQQYNIIHHRYCGEKPAAMEYEFTDAEEIYAFIKTAPEIIYKRLMEI